VLADVKMLTGIDLDHSVKDKMDTLSSKIGSNNQFITGISNSVL
jgi:hypothetical protein